MTLVPSPVNFPAINISLFGLESDRRSKSDRIADKVKLWELVQNFKLFTDGYAIAVQFLVGRPSL
jgi:hypothetical protein